MTAKLRTYEWCVILLFCSIMLVLASYATIRSKPVMDSLPLPPLPAPSQQIQITVIGEVVHAGLHYLPQGSKMQNVLDLVQPLPSADLSQLNYRRRLRDGQTVQIPQRQKMTIQISGAVKSPGSIEMLSGTRYCDWIPQLEVLPEADISKLKKRKGFIQNGVSIEIPVKKKKGVRKK